MWEWSLKRSEALGIDLDEMSHNYGTPVVAETSDWWLNDVAKSALDPKDVHDAFTAALNQNEVLEGQNGGGASMTCHMFPGGTGTSSRVVEGKDGKKYTVGVLVQSNYGHNYDLQIAGVPIGKLMLKEGTIFTPGSRGESKSAPDGKADDGSIVVMLMLVLYKPTAEELSMLTEFRTDAPMLPHQLNRLARHCAVGLAQVGGHGVGRNFSGDIILALSTANKPNERVMTPQVLGVGPIETNEIKIIKNESIDTMFRAASEVTEEAILNSMIAGREGRTGNKGLKMPGLPVERVKDLLEKYRVVV
jgi:D-aminopeptidase